VSELDGWAGGVVEVRYQWRTEHVRYLELQERLNKLSTEGWDIFTVSPVGELSERRTTTERIGSVYFVITARKFERE
jgi:hypothetical protein